MAEPQQITIDVGEQQVTVLRHGAGRPLVILHDELGFPGWMSWNDALAGDFEQLIPLQPGFGVTPGLDWIGDYRDVAALYLWMLREHDVDTFDLVGFSAGGYIAAEMAVASRERVNRLTLVAPLGIKPIEGEILDFLAMTPRSHIAATVSRPEAPEFAEIYGGEMSPEQFVLFSAARAETSRLGWAPFMHSLSLPHRLAGLGDLPTLIVWGDADRVVPRSAMEQYRDAIPNARLEIIEGVGHRPEIEAPSAFVEVVGGFLAAGVASSPVAAGNLRVANSA